jgi:hypothetical protein
LRTEEEESAKSKSSAIISARLLPESSDKILRNAYDILDLESRESFEAN